MITKIAFVGQPTRDLEKAKAFYSLLGLEHQADYHDAWAEYAGPDGKTIALDTFSPKASEHATSYLALETDDIDAELTRLQAGGVTVVKPVWENKDGEGNSVCKMALIADPDGNPIMLHQIDPKRA